MHLLQGAVAAEKGKTDKAVAEISPLIDPTFGRSVNGLATETIAHAYQQAGNLDQAIVWYEKLASPLGPLTFWEPQQRWASAATNWRRTIKNADSLRKQSRRSRRCSICGKTLTAIFRCEKLPCSCSKHCPKIVHGAQNRLITGRVVGKQVPMRAVVAKPILADAPVGPMNAGGPWPGPVVLIDISKSSLSTGPSRNSVPAYITVLVNLNLERLLRTSTSW